MRFTRDGSDALEHLIAQTCDEIACDMRRIIPPAELQALVLAGGYGRGEGGVLATAQGDAPYNDLEFFVLIRGNPRANERRYGAQLHEVERLRAAELGIDVEFKILSLEKLRTSPTTMFYYDLVSGHRIISGPPDILASCAMHGDASRIPLHEGTRLLMNRCSGLLFASQRLQSASFTSEDADFTGRNIAKAKLAIGDVVLTGLGRYHWSCVERQTRLSTVEESSLPMDEIRALHVDGVAFKLHPHQAAQDIEALKAAHKRVAAAAWAVWIWLEQRRLAMPAVSPLKYGRSINKCPETFALKNVLVRLRAFGVKGVLSPHLMRYPREALLNTFPLLLWAPELAQSNLGWLSGQLVSPVTDWNAAVTAYARLWAKFN